MTGHPAGMLRKKKNCGRKHIPSLKLFLKTVIIRMILYGEKVLAKIFGCLCEMLSAQ
jgi:hypothetical protein